MRPREREPRRGADIDHVRAVIRTRGRGYALVAESRRRTEPGPLTFPVAALQQAPGRRAGADDVPASAASY